MMGLGLGLRLVQTQALALTGGATQTIFPRVERWLNESSDHQEGLKYVARFKDMDRYRSVMDFLFCEMFQPYQRGCFKFYDDEGPALRGIITDEEIAVFERKLMYAVKYAYGIFCEARKRSWDSGKENWTTFRAAVIRRVA